MKFTEKYTLDKTKEGEDKKVQVSTDYFALCETIDELNKVLRSFK